MVYEIRFVNTHTRMRSEKRTEALDVTLNTSHQLLINIIRLFKC